MLEAIHVIEDTTEEFLKEFWEDNDYVLSIAMGDNINDIDICLCKIQFDVTSLLRNVGNYRQELYNMLSLAIAGFVHKKALCLSNVDKIVVEGVALVLLQQTGNYVLETNVGIVPIINK